MYRPVWVQGRLHLAWHRPVIRLTRLMMAVWEAAETSAQPVRGASREPVGTGDKRRPFDFIYGSLKILYYIFYKTIDFIPKLVYT